jgi:hypothetical protein
MSRVRVVSVYGVQPRHGHGQILRRGIKKPVGDYVANIELATAEDLPHERQPADGRLAAAVFLVESRWLSPKSAPSRELRAATSR